MLSYQHIYHAGNFADVQKHSLLARVVRTLASKPLPMIVLDTHAGRGVYDLTSAEAEKNREYANGISHFWDKRETFSPLKTYLDIVAKFNPSGELKRYPGSSMIARALMKPNEDLICIERHPGEFEKLDAVMGKLPRTEVFHDDGLVTLVKMTPFPENRGLVIIDPSYEMKEDYEEVPRYIRQAYKKWPQGTYFLWYPIMDGEPHKKMLKALRESEIKDILISEIRLERAPEDHFRMYGSGIAIVRPPWPQETMGEITQYLTTEMPVKSSGKVFWLDNMKIDPDTGELV